MAPLSRGKGGSRGTATRGRGGSRGRGRGRGGFAARGGNKPTFQSTRVEEHVEDDAVRSEESEDLDQEEPVDEASEDISSGDEDSKNSMVKPYNALLKSLNANVQRGQPQRKRRRVDGNADKHMATADKNGSEGEQLPQGDVDEVKEPEEGGILGAEGTDATEGWDDDEEGKCAWCFMSV